MSAKKRILILCGGQSSEHQVSLLSGLSVKKFIPTDRYEPIFVGIDKKGRWFTGEPLIQNPEDPKTIQLGFNLEEAQLEKGKLNGLSIDCVFSVLHGTLGEDGAMQGFLEMQGVPFIGSGSSASAIGMDKDLLKRIALSAEIATAPFVTLYAGEPPLTYDNAKELLGGLLFVKPARQGSSIGISKVGNETEYHQALDLAFRFDDKLVVEQAIAGRELEVAVLGNRELIASYPGEVIPDAEFYSYEAKYITGGSQLILKPDLSKPTILEIQEKAKRLFRLLGLSGLARIDFFLDPGGKLWLNEPNTLPGFTHISMYPKMMEIAGTPYPELIHRLIELGIQRAGRQRQIYTNLEKL